MPELAWDRATANGSGDLEVPWTDPAPDEAWLQGLATVLSRTESEVRNQQWDDVDVYLEGVTLVGFEPGQEAYARDYMTQAIAAVPGRRDDA